MNTKIVIGVVIALALLGIGGWYMMSQTQILPNSASNVGSQSNPASGVITSIQDAMAGSKSLQCEYTNEQGAKTTVYIKGQNVRTDMIVDDAKENSAIVMGNKLWSWDTKTKKGVMMEYTDEMKAKMMEMADKYKSAPQMSTNTPQSKDDFLATIEKYKDSCKMASVNDDQFVVPTDVQFQDYSEMMKSMQQMMNVTGKPSSTDIQKQMEEMMKKAPTGQ